MFSSLELKYVMHSFVRGSLLGASLGNLLWWEAMSEPIHSPYTPIPATFSSLIRFDHHNLPQSYSWISFTLRAVLIGGLSNAFWACLDIAEQRREPSHQFIPPTPYYVSLYHLFSSPPRQQAAQQPRTSSTAQPVAQPAASGPIIPPIVAPQRIAPRTALFPITQSTQEVTEAKDQNDLALTGLRHRPNDSPREDATNERRYKSI